MIYVVVYYSIKIVPIVKTYNLYSNSTYSIL